MSAASRVIDAVPTAVPAGWDCHVHVFEAGAPVRPGHYLPAHRPLAQIEATALAHGIGHLVLVQPSVYGSDNTVLLRALQVTPGRHRGVAVLDAGTGEAEFDRLHAAGVRGVRFNLVSPAGHAGDVEPELLRLAPRLRARGWHVQWYVQAHDLPRLVPWQARTGLRFVLDHLAGLHARLPEDHPAWDSAQALADAGAWLKLSGWYRLQATAPYAELLPTVRRAAVLFGPHLVWGSDWPHTSFSPDQMPGYASTLDPARGGLAEPAFTALLQTQPPSLYL